jgi:Cu(I)/Ag(I) efflux system membrane protein CusA/SilA
MLLYLNQAYRRHEDRARTENRPVDIALLREAVIEGALLRVRPIMMTVATVIVGLLPVMLGSGTGSEVMRRIAAPMVGGMVSAVLLTLLVIPAAFLIWHRRRIHED